MDKSNQPSLLKRYQLLIAFTRDLASTLDLNLLLNHIVEAACKLCDAEDASILFYDATTQELRFEVASNLEKPKLGKITIPASSSIAGWIAVNRQPLIVADTKSHQAHFGSVDEISRFQIHSLLGVPLIANDKVIGVLEVVNKREQDFSTEDQDLLTSLGAQASVAIENARLFQQSDLIAELVHEIRTPLASLSTATHLLTHPDLHEKQRQRITEMIQSEVHRLSELTTAFLDLSRLESGRMQFKPHSFDIGSLLIDCKTMMDGRAAERDIMIHLDLPEDSLRIEADADKLKQVLLNLISNAIKYNQPKGEIRIWVEELPDQLSISIQDNGPGISFEHQEHLFEKFYRAPGSENMAPGTGLGLSICKRIIEAHGGKITVNSQTGLGSTFTIFLPYLSPASTTL